RIQRHLILSIGVSLFLTAFLTDGVFPVLPAFLIVKLFYRLFCLTDSAGFSHRGISLETKVFLQPLQTVLYDSHIRDDKPCETEDGILGESPHAGHSHPITGEFFEDFEFLWS